MPDCSPEYYQKLYQKLSIPQQHQLKIAKDTLKMSDAMVRVMGGMTKEEAQKIVEECILTELG